MANSHPALGDSFEEVQFERDRPANGLYELLVSWKVGALSQI
ncbi:hypothetical protein [Nocardia beijingensis]|nr:hypothetical protein [Nocardia beijingensis]